ncbi:MAG: helix-hairpin-helix domain-containing protein [Candidatus Kapaibacteriales bacterium]
MKNYLYIIIVTLLSLSLHPVKFFAQSSVEKDITEIIEFELLLEQLARDFGQSLDADMLEYYHSRPIRREFKNLELIADLPLIDRNIAFLIVNNSEKSLDEISRVLQLSPLQYSVLGNTVLFDEMENSTIPELVKKEDIIPLEISYRLRGRYDIEEKSGFMDNTYLGDRSDYFQRLNIGYVEFRGIIITSKDDGESSYMDYLSGGLQYQSEGTRIILGEYVQEWGQGAVNWRRFGSRKGGEAVSPALRNSASARINTGSIPDGTMRGLTATQDFLGFQTSLWYSKQDLDGNAEGESITSILRTGYFRTENQEIRRGTVEEQVIGGSIRKKIGDYYFGGLVQNISYSKPLAIGSSSYFDGKSNTFTSFIGGGEITDKLSFDTEVALDSDLEINTVAGITYKDRNEKGVFSIRHSSPEYASPYSNTFGEYSGSKDESGLYIGYQKRFSNRTVLNTFLDLYQSSRSRFGTNLPVRGWDWLSQIRLLPENNNQLIIRARLENRFDRFGMENQKTPENNFYRVSARADFVKEVGRDFRARFRGEYSSTKVIAQTAFSEGFLTSVEFDYRFVDWLKSGTRFTVFSTDNFQSAIWQYEYVFSGYSSTPVLYGKGYRWTLESDFNITDNIGIAMRYALDKRSDQDSFGTGGERIDGNFRSNIIVQLEVDY